MAKSREKWSFWDYALNWTAIATFVTTNSPADMIRFRMQVMPLLVEQGHLPQPYQGCLDCATTIFRNQGLRGYFKGNLSNLIRVVPSQALVFQLKQYLQRHFHYHQRLSQGDHVRYNTLIGVAAGLVVSLTLYPFEVIRQRLLNRTDRKGRSINHYLRKTVTVDGISGFYRGALIFSVGLIIFRGTYFGVYDSLKVKTNDESLRWLASVGASYLSIATGYPIDTVRRRFISCRGKYKTTLECFSDIWQKQGWRGFILGWQMIWLQSLGLATIFFFYDRLVTDYDQAVH